MSGPLAVIVLALASIAVTLAYSPQVGLFLAVAAFGVIVVIIIDRDDARRDAARRNHARRK